MARNAHKNARIARRLYRALITDEVGGGALSVARRLGVSRSQIYALCKNASTLPAYMVTDLFLATGDVELLCDLLDVDRMDLTIVERRAPGEVLSENTRAAGLRLGADAGRVLGVLEEAEADGVITELEEDAINAEIARLERRAAELRGLVARRRPTLAVVAG